MGVKRLAPLCRGRDPFSKGPSPNSRLTPRAALAWRCNAGGGMNAPCAVKVGLAIRSQGGRLAVAPQSRAGGLPKKGVPHSIRFPSVPPLISLEVSCARCHRQLSVPPGPWTDGNGEEPEPELWNWAAKGAGKFRDDGLGFILGDRAGRIPPVGTSIAREGLESGIFREVKAGGRAGSAPRLKFAKRAVRRDLFFSYRGSAFVWHWSCKCGSTPARSQQPFEEAVLAEAKMRKATLVQVEV